MLKALNKRKNQDGFTLIELIVVIAIIGILAAIALPRLGAFREGADKGAAVAEASAIASATRMYLLNNDKPADAAALLTGLNNEGFIATDDLGISLTAVTFDDSGSDVESLTFTINNDSDSTSYTWEPGSETLSE